MAEAATVMRRLLVAVDDGDLRADGPVGARIVRGLHGAVVALEAVGSSTRRGVRRSVHREEAHRDGTGNAGAHRALDDVGDGG